jgi:hypothetical protein
MSETPTKLVVDLSKPQSDPDRVRSIPLTEEELIQREADALAAQEAETARLAEEEAKASAKASAHEKLAALGLTEEEIAALTA